MAITRTYDLLNVNGEKGWVRDSWARRAIARIQKTLTNLVIPTATSQLTNDSGFITIDNTFFGTPTAIPSNADLDTYNTVGHYSAGTSTVASSLTNCPTTVNFSLFVLWRTSSLKSQIIIAATTTLYYRYQSSSGWSAWRKIATTAV